MTAQITDLQKQERLERSCLMNRLQVLSRELQPHFLFNVLNGIAALMRDDPCRAETMLLRLSDLLRISLRAGADVEISLRQELQQLDLYLDLQAMRFGNRLTVGRDVEPATLVARVPCMLLQPLVDDALTHGIGPRVGSGRLDLTARRIGDMLVLRVRDDGQPHHPDHAWQDRTGIAATRARLLAHFDGAHRFTVSPVDGGGTVAEVRIPFIPRV